MKIIKRIFTFAILFAMCFVLTTSSFAATEKNSNVSLKLVEDNICTINLDNKATLEKKLTKIDTTKKSATLTLTVKNTMKKTEKELPAEIFLVIDNSDSMIKNKVDGKTRKEVVIDAANLLVDKLFSLKSDVKVGIVSFSSLDSVKGETEGTINDAKLELPLSSSKTDVKAAISGIASRDCGPRTNIQAGLKVAADNLSYSVSSNIVLLTDGVPNNDLNGNFGTYIGPVGETTKNYIKSLQTEKGITIIGSMIGLDSEKVETQSKKTYKTLAEEVFGTVDNSTISKYYYIPDDKIGATVTEEIYKDLVATTDSTMKNIVVKDYFPKEIIDNFNFEYVASPNIGKVSQKVDTKDNSITWNIQTLEAGKSATLTYKLTLKDTFDKTIIDKVLPTNKKVEFSGENDGKKIEKTSTVSPKIKVIAKSQVVDKTISPKKIPQAGEFSGIVVIAIIGTISVFLGIRYIYLKRNMK